eukprot:Amastigsp_a351788_23.p1 type:complete len:227 gc:universal Amastigsp_a351788_23:44-724(+)
MLRRAASRACRACTRLQSTEAPPSGPPLPPSTTYGPAADGWQQIYHGPFEKPVRSVKMFSMSSLAITAVGSPLLAVLASEKMPLAAGVTLAVSAVAVSCSTTGLLAWCAKPYVTRLWVKAVDRSHLRAERVSMFGRRYLTELHTDDVMLSSGRPFASFRQASTGDVFFLHANFGDAAYMDVLARLSADTQTEIARAPIREQVRKELDAAGFAVKRESTSDGEPPRA